MVDGNFGEVEGTRGGFDLIKHIIYMYRFSKIYIYNEKLVCSAGEENQVKVHLDGTHRKVERILMMQMAI